MTDPRTQQAEWDRQFAEVNAALATRGHDRPSLASIIGGAGLIVFALVAWNAFLIVTNGAPQ